MGDGGSQFYRSVLGLGGVSFLLLIWRDLVTEVLGWDKS